MDAGNGRVVQVAKRRHESDYEVPGDRGWRGEVVCRCLVETEGGLSVLSVGVDR